MRFKTQSTVLMLMLFAAGCNHLRIAGYPQDPEPAGQNFLTAAVNYHRNAVISSDLKPPLIQSWKKDYLFFPENGITVDENIFFFGSGTGFLAAASVETGKLLGKKHLGKACMSPPTIYAGILYQTFAEGKAGLIAYDLAKGRVLWQIPGNTSKSSVVVKDRKIFFMNSTGLVQCRNYLTGDLIWFRQVDSQAANSPALHENMLVTAGLTGKISALEYTSGVELWETALDKDAIIADPVIQGERLYLATYRGFLLILDLKSGEVLHSQEFSSPFYCTPVVDPAAIYLPLSSGRLLALDLQSQDLLWEYRADGPWASAPLVTPNYIYAGNLDEKLYILDKKSGELLQEIKLKGRARSTPVIIDNKLILTCENTTVLAYGQEQTKN